MKKQFSIFILVLSVVLLSNNSFGIDSLNWKECLKITLENNPDLVSAKESVNQAKARVGTSRSGLLPSVNLNAGAQKSTTEYGEELYPGGPTSTEQKQFSAGASAGYTIDGGQSIYNWKSAQASKNAADYGYLVKSGNLRRNLRYAFIQLLSRQELLKINEDIFNIRKRNIDLVNVRYNAGLEHLGSLLTAQANLAQAEYEIEQSRRDINIGKANLCKSMGIDISGEYIAEGDFTIPPYNDKPDMLQLADSNPQIKQILQQRLAAEYNDKSALLAYAPQVSLNGSVNRNGAEFPPNDSTTLSLGAQLSFNVFQGGRTTYQKFLTDAALKQLTADEKSQKIAVLYSLEEAWSVLQGRISNVKVQEKYLQAAEERAKIADKQYSIGSIVFDNWNTIQDSLISAKRNYLNALANAMLAEADWIQIKGGNLNNEN